MIQVSLTDLVFDDECDCVSKMAIVSKYVEHLEYKHWKSGYWNCTMANLSFLTDDKRKIGYVVMLLANDDHDTADSIIVRAKTSPVVLNVLPSPIREINIDCVFTMDQEDS